MSTAMIDLSDLTPQFLDELTEYYLKTKPYPNLDPRIPSERAARSQARMIPRIVAREAAQGEARHAS